MLYHGRTVLSHDRILWQVFTPKSQPIERDSRVCTRVEFRQSVVAVEEIDNFLGVPMKYEHWQMSVFIIIRSSRLLFARYRHISFVQTASSPARHESTHDGLRLCQLKPQRVAKCTNRITVCGIEVVIVDSANPVLIALGGVVQRLQHQILRRVGEQVSVLLESNDQCCTNKTTPVRVPRVVDVRG